MRYFACNYYCGVWPNGIFYISHSSMFIYWNSSVKKNCPFFPIYRIMNIYFTLWIIIQFVLYLFVSQFIPVLVTGIGCMFVYVFLKPFYKVIFGNHRDDLGIFPIIHWGKSFKEALLLGVVGLRSKVS